MGYPVIDLSRTSPRVHHRESTLVPQRQVCVALCCTFNVFVVDADPVAVISGRHVALNLKHADIRLLAKSNWF